MMRPRPALARMQICLPAKPRQKRAAEPFRHCLPPGVSGVELIFDRGHMG